MFGFGRRENYPVKMVNRSIWDCHAQLAVVDFSVIPRVSDMDLTFDCGLVAMSGSIGMMSHLTQTSSLTEYAQALDVLWGQERPSTIVVGGTESVKGSMTFITNLMMVLATHGFPVIDTDIGEDQIHRSVLLTPGYVLIDRLVGHQDRKDRRTINF